MGKYDLSQITKGDPKGLLKETSSTDSPKPPATKRPKKRAVKKQPGRIPDPPGTFVELNLTEVPRQEGMPSISVNGAGRRQEVQPLTLPIPKEIYDRVKSEANVSAALVALITYGLETIDQKKITLFANYKKTKK